MAKFLWVFCVLALWVLANGAPPSSSPPPPVDCSNGLLSMADCLSFVQNGSTIATPEGTCCAGLKSVVKNSPSCLCQVLKGKSDFGIALNMTRGLQLPSLCELSTPPLSNCDDGGAPVPAPGPSPKMPPPPKKSPSPSPSPVSPLPSARAPATPISPPPSGANVGMAPAPSPSHSGAPALTFSFAALLVSISVASIAYY
ncbi:non-specific lipid transfer protein GPI-anchored 11-like [Tasmannia lanceolata]|uniref:non-specific lipid transfer protein GPI-anchored 11-like n=1 Tax=Tasmannia lanceolata TaxID=3420 RepID=UPI004062B69D